MKREIYDEDHEAFRSSVKEFLDREVRPHVEEHAAAKAIPREFWLAAGKQGFLGLEIPEEYGGMAAGDYRFNAVLTEELAKVNMSLPSCVGIHADIVAPYLVHLTNDEQKQRWLPGFCTGELLTAIGMTEPSGGSDLAALKTTAVADGDDWVLNGSKTFITNGYSADLVVVAARTSPEKKARGITLFGVDTTAEGFARGRKLDKVGQDESDTAELCFDRPPRLGRRRHRRGRLRLHPHDDVPAAGAARLGDHQPRARRADPRRDARLHQGPQGLRPVDRRLPAQQVPARRPLHPGRGHPGLRRPVRPRAHQGRAHPDRRGQGQVVDRRRCRTTSSTTASSCTAATAS